MPKHNRIDRRRAKKGDNSRKCKKKNNNQKGLPEIVCIGHFHLEHFSDYEILIERPLLPWS